jgi:hypothetical protein
MEVLGSDASASATSTDSSTSSQATASQIAPAVDTSTPITSADTSAAPVASEQPAYTPDYKFKVMDKELEMDEFLRPAIKSKEHEQKLKELYEKAHGLDEVKTSREKAREEYKSYKTQAEPVIRTVQQASNFYQTGVRAYEEGNARGGTFKLEQAFKELGINDKVLQQYVFTKLKMEELPPEQKADYNRQREQDLQFAQMQQQMQEQQSYFQQMAVQTRTQQLQQAISSPEVASIAQSFDQRNGPGSFQNEVIARGQLYWQTRQQDVPADQLVQEIITKYGLSAQQAQPQAQAPREVPVIPVVKGNSGSPAGKAFNSTADLINYRKQQFGS